jgi:hypothetical protein
MFNGKVITVDKQALNFESRKSMNVEDLSSLWQPTFLYGESLNGWKTWKPSGLDDP